jgi:hypothetical protein
MSATDQQVPQSAELPSSADFDKARDALEASHDAVEEVKWALEGYRTAFYAAPTSPPTPPDDAYVGALWRFVDDVDTRCNELTGMVIDLTNLLGSVDAVGREADFRAKLAREADNG